jgi:hypothetical protein
MTPKACSTANKYQNFSLALVCCAEINKTEI